MSGDQGVEKELSADEASRPQRRHPQVAVAFVSVRMIKKRERDAIGLKAGEILASEALPTPTL